MLIDLRHSNIKLLIISLGLITIVITNVQSQDVIYRNDGTEIEAKVIEITTEVVKYKNYEQLSGPVRNISISEVFIIIYEDGTREIFNKKENDEVLETEIDDYHNINQEQVINSNQGIQSNDNIKPDTKWYFGGSPGYFIPVNDLFSEIYGSGFIWGLHTGVWIDDLGLALDLKSFSKDGDPYTINATGTCHINIIPLTLTGSYSFWEQGPLFSYGGVGIGVAWINEELDAASVWGDDLSDDATLKRFAWQFMGGIQFKPLYFELTFLNIMVGDSNLGGIILGFGLIF